MGSCAGCANPDRKQPYRKNMTNKRLSKTESGPLTTNLHPYSHQKDNKNNKNHKNMDYSLNLINQISNSKSNSHNMLNNTAHFTTDDNSFFSKSKQKPWKQKVVGRTISKYIKPTTLKQEQQKIKEQNPQTFKQRQDRQDGITNFTNFILSNQINNRIHQNLITDESLEQSVLNRKNQNTLNYPYSKMQRNKTQNNFKQINKQNLFDTESQIKQIFDSSSIYNEKLPSKDNYSPVHAIEISSFYHNEHEDVSASIHSNPYYSSQVAPFPKKALKQEQLDMITQMFDKETETPAYVRQERAKYGEDIKNDNFGMFQAIPEIEHISINNYLKQID